MTHDAAVLCQTNQGTVFWANYSVNPSTDPIVLLVKMFKVSTYAYEDLVEETKVVRMTSHLDCIPNAIAVNLHCPAIIYSFSSSKSLEQFIEE